MLPPAPTKLKEMVYFVKDKRGWPLTDGDSLFTFDVRLNDGRNQIVHIKSVGKDVHGNETILIESKACAVKDLEEGLRKRKSGGLTNLLVTNYTNDHVHFCIDDQELVWSKAGRMLDNLNENELEVLIFAAASQADALEKEKFGDKDVY